MRIQGILIAATVLSVAAPSQAKKKVIEDPFEYEQRQAEREQEKEEAEEEARMHVPFGNAGDFVISAERLVGYAHTSTVEKVTGPDNKTQIDRVNVLTSPGGDPTGYSAPRLALDIFVARRISLGGAFAYGQNSGDITAKLISLAPRFGVAYMFGDVVGIWPRLGASYQVMFGDAYNAWLLGGNFELPLVLVAGGHAAFTLGPRVDVGFVGQRSPEGGDVNKLTAVEFGFSAGMSLFF